VVSVSLFFRGLFYGFGEFVFLVSVVGQRFRRLVRGFGGVGQRFRRGWLVVSAGLVRGFGGFS
jgi:hypothetical protein